MISDCRAYSEVAPPSYTTYDAENRLTAMSGGVTSSYVYNADGMRVKETAGGATTVYIGNYFEWTGSTATMKSYYYAGAVRVAMRTGTSTGTVNYLLGDHLSSQALTLTSAGARLNTNTELRYYPWGGGRYTAGATPTTFNFTGQRKDSGSGLLYYGARWYDPAVGRFISADTIVPEPGNSQSLNRYSYAANNPLRFVDPSGHYECEDDKDCQIPKQPPRRRVFPDRDLTQFAVAQAQFMVQSPVTSWLAFENAHPAPTGTPGFKVSAYLTFQGLVGDGKRWDIKDEMLSQLGSSFLLCSASICYLSPIKTSFRATGTLTTG